MHTSNCIQQRALGLQAYALSHLSSHYNCAAQNIYKISMTYISVLYNARGTYYGYGNLIATA